MNKKWKSFFVNRSNCDCGDINCTRRVKYKPNGTLYVVNHFTCGKIKDFILTNKKRYMKLINN